MGGTSTGTLKHITLRLIPLFKSSFPRLTLIGESCALLNTHVRVGVGNTGWGSYRGRHGASHCVQYQARFSRTNTACSLWEGMTPGTRALDHSVSPRTKLRP